ncbi:hypothetical protein SY88_16950 [Clostridiales bacterium PH28_bin88]|nr:hypothetical protein SY88_16950 [Clostridiales bacterium PH28_bin88]
MFAGIAGAISTSQKKTPAEPAPLLGCLSGRENLRPAATIRVLPCHDLVGSAMLCCFAEFLKRAGVPEILDQMLTPVRKIVSYTATDYLLTLVLSVAVGCDFNVAINHLLRPYPQVARLLDMPGFPEQSSVSGFLHTLSAASLEELDLGASKNWIW